MRDRNQFVIRYAINKPTEKPKIGSVVVIGKKRRDEVMALIESVGYKFLSAEILRREKHDTGGNEGNE